MNLIYIVATAVLCINVQASPVSISPARDLHTTSAGVESYPADSPQEGSGSEYFQQDERQPDPAPEQPDQPYIPEYDLETDLPPDWPPNYHPDHWPEDDVFIGEEFFPEDDAIYFPEHRILTDSEHLANIDYSLQILVSAVFLVLSIGFIWFFILKPITWFIYF